MNQAADTMLVHYSQWSMMAVLQEEDENCTSNPTLQYLLLLLSKVALNTLVLSFWLRSISKTLLGLYSISIYLADLLLICSIIWAWWIWQNHGTYEVMCFSLSHSSAVYSLLPLPVFLAGALDCVLQQHVGFSKKSTSRTTIHCMVLLLMWTLAGLYSYYYTNPELLKIQYKEGVTALVCSVQGTMVVSHFSLSLLIIVSLILLLHCGKLPRWLSLANKLAKQRNSACSMSDLAFSEKLEKLESQASEEEPMDNQRNRPPLTISLVLCFALNWTPFLIISTICDLLGFAVPAYVSVNLLWTACANSLLVGLVFWYRINKHGPLGPLLDDICQWGFFWYLSSENNQFTTTMQIHNGQD